MNESQSYQEWYKRVNEICMDVAGVGIDDLADGPSRDAYEAGYTPREYARERLTEEGFLEL